MDYLIFDAAPTPFSLFPQFETYVLFLNWKRLVIIKSLKEGILFTRKCQKKNDKEELPPGPKLVKTRFHSNYIVFPFCHSIDINLNHTAQNKNAVVIATGYIKQ